jgi:Shikimate 5'-dehydrogenase C-terminal domain
MGHLGLLELGCTVLCATFETVHIQHPATFLCATARPCTSSIQPRAEMPAILLQDAKAAKCTPISGLEMFVGQAADQFQLFTGKDAPVDLMRQTVLDSLAKQ